MSEPFYLPEEANERPFTDGDAQEILQKVTQFETDHAGQLGDFQRNSKLYRAIPTKRRKEQQSNTFYPEITIEVEALATAVHEMVFSDNSAAGFFQMAAGTNSTDARVRAWVSQAVLEKQLELTDMKSRFLSYLRKLILQGTYPIHVPWRLDYKTIPVQGSRVEKVVFDSWDFEPFDIVNFGFDDSQAFIERGEFAYRLINVTPSSAYKMKRLGVWDAQVVDEAAKNGYKRNIYDSGQRQDAGYSDTQSGAGGLTAIDYYGTLSSRNDGITYWAVVDRNSGRFLRKPQFNSYAHGEKPWLVGKWIDLPDEAYAIGIGTLNYRTSNELNDRRNFINDLLYQSLYCMWLKRSDSGIVLPGNKMAWKPHEVIEADGITEEFFRALRPDMSGLPAAINVEDRDIERMRRTSGATSGLQAVATGVTATEQQSVQSEATRRVKAMVRSQIASLLRQFVTRAHQLNLQFLDRPLSAKYTGSDGLEVFGEVTREDLIINPDVSVKLTTDLDFRPFKRRELIEMLTAFANLDKMGALTRRRIIPDPIIEELAQTYNMDPRKFFSKEGLMETMTQQQMTNPQVQQQALQQIVQESPAAQMVLGGQGA